MLTVGGVGRGVTPGKAQGLWDALLTSNRGRCSASGNPRRSGISTGRKTLPGDADHPVRAACSSMMRDVDSTAKHNSVGNEVQQGLRSSGDDRKDATRWLP